MNTKRLFALLIAVFMLIALFSACATDEDTNDDQANVGTNGDDTANTGNEGDDANDAPPEGEKRSIEWLGNQGANTYATAEEARDNNFATYEALMDLVTEDYNLDYTWTIIYSDAYLTTLSGYIAANTLPDMFSTREILDDTTMNQLIEAGRLASVDDILEYSDGSSKSYYNTDGQLLYLKAFATVSDGNWYYVPLPNTTGSSFDFSNSKYDLRANGQIHGAYSVCVRQDWLDKLSLSMPSTTEEFHQMLLTFQEQDANGNGTADERYIGLLGSDFQTTGVGQWFGLPYTDFIEDPATGVIEVSCLTKGYKEFCDYMASLYADNLVYVEGTHPWGNATEIGANTVAAIGMMPSNLQFWNTGDPNSMYMPMPIVQAVEGVEPRLLIQESEAAFVGFSFSVDCDYQAAGTFMDFLTCQDTYMIFKFGIEGTAWDWNEDGTITSYTLDEGDLESYGSAQTYWLGNNAFPINGGHHGNLWGVPQATYDDIDEALAAGEPYTEENQTRESWQEQHGVGSDVISGAEQMLLLLKEFGVDNYHPTAYYSYTTMATNEEAAIIAQYETELKTYLLEMTTNMIVGSTSTDTIDEQVQFAYDNLGLQEYINVMQARVNRYLEAIGREPVEINE